VGYVGWVVLLICLFSGATLFFSVNAIALRTFSRAKLQDAFKTANTKEENHDDLIDQIVDNSLSSHL